MKFQKETKIGLIIIAILAMFLWGLNYLKGRNLFTTQKQYFAVFEHIDGLQKSSVVSANGYSIGQVSDITFVKGKKIKILVEISVKRQFEIPKNSIIEIYSSDIMGSKAMNLILGDSLIIAQENDTLRSKIAQDLSSLLAKQIIPLKTKAENLIVSVDSVLGIVRNTFSPKTQQSIQRSLLGIEELIYTEKTKISLVMDNLVLVTKNLEKSNKSITNILNNVSSLSDSLAASNLKTAINNANSTLAEANLLLSKLNAGKGSLGKILNDDSLYIALHRTVKDLDSLLVDLNKHPKRYVHFSLFGSKNK